VMRFVPPLAALADGPVEFVGDEQAELRPMDPLLQALSELGATVESANGKLPFRITGRPDLPGGVVTVDASASSQFVSGLLLAGARYAAGVEVRHQGLPIPSRPHIEMTVAMLRGRHVRVDESDPNRWVVTPGSIAAHDVTVEPDLSNAAPFLAAAALTGGTVTIPHWPGSTHQPGDLIRDILTAFGAQVGFDERGLTVHGTNHIHGVTLDLSGASELTPVVAAIAALADGTSHIHGVAHIRGHETDRLASLRSELHRLGSNVHETHDGLTIHPRMLGGELWRTYADHRMAQAGALLGLVVPDVELDDIDCTAKTMPEFERLWLTMIDDSTHDGEAPDR
jgi:3-phosphoshikimate 1-carboxyvinyltransferase